MTDARSGASMNYSFAFYRIEILIFPKSVWLFFVRKAENIVNRNAVKPRKLNQNFRRYVELAALIVAVNPLAA